MADSTESKDDKASEAEADREQVEKPHAEPEGTTQDNEDMEPRPTDLGEAREKSGGHVKAGRKS